MANADSHQLQKLWSESSQGPCDPYRNSFVRLTKINWIPLPYKGFSLNGEIEFTYSSSELNSKMVV